MIDELGLADHGLRYLPVEPLQLNLPWSGGPAWPLFPELQRTEEALAATYPGEVEGFRRYLRDARPAVELVLELANAPPTAPGSCARCWPAAAGASRPSCAGAAARRPRCWRDYFTTDAVIGPAIVTGPAVWGRVAVPQGHGHGRAVSYAMKHVAGVARPEGGSGALPAASLAAFEHAGGKVRLGSLVDGHRVRRRQRCRACGWPTARCSRRRSSCRRATHGPRSSTGSPNRRAAAAKLVARWTGQPPSRRLRVQARRRGGRRCPYYRQVDARLSARLGYDPLVPSRP